MIFVELWYRLYNSIMLWQHIDFDAVSVTNTGEIDQNSLFTAYQLRSLKSIKKDKTLTIGQL